VIGHGACLRWDHDGLFKVWRIDGQWRFGVKPGLPCLSLDAVGNATPLGHHTVAARKGSGQSGSMLSPCALQHYCGLALGLNLDGLWWMVVLNWVDDNQWSQWYSWMEGWNIGWQLHQSNQTNLPFTSCSLLLADFCVSCECF
jgi:hypothetical protein